ncbi:hypothetical protein PVAND_004520 [Polypedilum vanderplanki]|uniref:BUD13 homolog n=1 Tax=Polypedilum vanderplanki TaxID=319348 RepID=A0A9J6BYE1_POLVA|nr:hypothetical protein PVAND_004520 [Polypedilum vanderplanki]
MSKIDQKEYLKRYLSNDDQLLKKKKKKNKDKKEKSIKTTVKIIDDNESAYTHHDEIDENDIYATNEEAPQIVGVIDERSATVILKQEYQQSGKWKGLDGSNIENKNKKKAEKNIEKRQKYSSDESPLRIAKKEDEKRKKRYSSDLSPPRTTSKSESKDLSKKIRHRYDSSDQSPPRTGKRKEEKQSNRYSSDLSPPRITAKNENKGSSKMSYRRHDSSDHSPFRKESKKDDSKKRHNSSDQSPPRIVKREDEKRKKRYSSDLSPPRITSKSERKNDSRKIYKRHDSSDQSPPRKEIKRERSPSSRKSRWSREKSPHNSDSSKMTKTLDGKASGLQNAKILKIENEKYKKRQKKIFDNMSDEESGRNADVVIRDRKGRNREYEYDLEKEKKKMEVEEARQKVYDKWSKGLKQVEAAEQRRREFEYEASKPLARSENDEDLQEYLKNQERLDDPMLQYMRKKRNEEKRSKGVMEKPVYLGAFPENRFGIRPGYRWDGVDRSNGYEKKYFTMINSKKSLEEEAYRYSTEDM